MSDVVFVNRFAARGRLLRGVAAALVVLVFWVAHPTWAEPTSATQAREVEEAGNIQGADFNLKGTPSITLPDTGIITCYCYNKDCSQDLWGGNSCPSPGQRYYGQDANYTGRQPSYRNNGDGTVTDQVTGLMWQQAEGSRNFPWGFGNYCSNLELGGYTDWRTPSRQELLSIVDYERSAPAINPVFSSYIDMYWSETEDVSGSRPSAWAVYFGDGSSGGNSKTSSHHYRCVRDAHVSFCPIISGPLYLLLQIIE